MASVLERSVLLRAILRHRWILLPVLAIAAALLEVHTNGPSSDGPYFAFQGRRLLSSNALHLYAQKGLQAGPLQVGAFGALARLTSLMHLPEDSTYAVISTLASLVTIVGGVRILRRRVGLADSPLAETLIGVLSIGWLVATEVYTSGHPAELVIPAAWIVAGLLAADDRLVLAGVVIGASAGFETWGVLGVPVLLVAANWRGVAKGIAAIVVTVAVLFGPFVIAGPFRMGQVTWPVAKGTFIHAIDPGLAIVPWSGRMLQSAVLVGLGVAAWLLARRRAPLVLIVWFIPAVLTVAKAISEPSGYDWYWLPAQVALLAGAALLDGLAVPTRIAVLFALAVSVTSPLHRWPIAVAALVGLFVAGAMSQSRSANEAVRRMPGVSTAA